MLKADNVNDVIITYMPIGTYIKSLIMKDEDIEYSLKQEAYIVKFYSGLHLLFKLGGIDAVLLAPQLYSFLAKIYKVEENEDEGTMSDYFSNTEHLKYQKKIINNILTDYNKEFKTLVLYVDSLPGLNNKSAWPKIQKNVFKYLARNSDSKELYTLVTNLTTLARSQNIPSWMEINPLKVVSYFFYNSSIQKFSLFFKNLDLTNLFSRLIEIKADLFDNDSFNSKQYSEIILSDQEINSNISNDNALFYLNFNTLEMQRLLTYAFINSSNSNQLLFESQEAAISFAKIFIPEKVSNVSSEIITFNSEEISNMCNNIKVILEEKKSKIRCIIS